VKKDVNDLGSKVDKKIDTAWFKWIVGACFAVAIGAYIFQLVK